MINKRTGYFRQLVGPFTVNEELINLIKQDDNKSIESIGIQSSLGTEVLVNGEKFRIDKEGILEFSQEKEDKKQEIISIKFLNKTTSNTIIDILCK